MKHIAIFASGTGTNARKILEHFENHPSIKVALIVSNKASAPVLDIAREYQLPSCVINRNYFYKTEELVNDLQRHEIGLIVLAGFLWLVPTYLVAAFPKQIINIHPALLPKYGGKGMYGNHVHQAVWEAKETQSGITIHYVNEKYDEGAPIFQATCSITPSDTPSDISQKVRLLEHQHFAKTIEKVLSVT